ncbi:MAG: hypothetical protein K2G96_00820 [Clostridia bacterium]|nr:hypothetical protein [Clostridia bacterium]
MSKLLNLSYYRKPVTKQKLKKELIIIFIIGIIWVLILMLPWLFWLKPYKKFGHYYAEAVYNENIFIVDAEHMRILYKIDGIEYEKVIDFHTTRHAMNELDFDYLLDNPYYILSYRTSWLVALPCIASAAIILWGWAIWNYKRELKFIDNQKIQEKGNNI